MAEQAGVEPTILESKSSALPFGYCSIYYNVKSLYRLYHPLALIELVDDRLQM